MSAGRDLRDEAARHEPVVGAVYLPGQGTRGNIVGCSCMDAREYRAAGFRAGADGWRDHFLAAVEPRIRAEVLAEVALEIRSASSIDINARAAISAVLSGRARCLAASTGEGEP